MKKPNSDKHTRTVNQYGMKLLEKMRKYASYSVIEDFIEIPELSLYKLINGTLIMADNHIAKLLDFLDIKDPVQRKALVESIAVQKKYPILDTAMRNAKFAATLHLKGLKVSQLLIDNIHPSKLSYMYNFKIDISDKRLVQLGDSLGVSVEPTSEDDAKVNQLMSESDQLHILMAAELIKQKCGYENELRKISNTFK